MNRMMTIIRDLAPLNRVFCSSDYDRSIEYLSAFLPFNVLAFKATDEHNGWTIPPKWDLKEARIFKDGKLIYDGTSHALSVIALSRPFQGRVDLAELKKHLHYDHRYEDVIPYHFRQEYRSWERDWGFCVPKRFYDTLLPGEYEVSIQTEESEGILKVLE
jgi:aminopeptidase-like protein